MRIVFLIIMTVFISTNIFAQNLIQIGEKHLSNLRQLTFGGENAEAYFSADGTKLIYQASGKDYKCDQIFSMNIDGSEVTLISSGEGRTTCAFYNPTADEILYASTFSGGKECPPVPSMEFGYVWPIYASYDIYTAKPDGSEITVIASSPAYDAEAVYSRDGSKIVFTSTRDGDLELYVMNSDGTDIKRVTNNPGYDGGAFFSPDGKQLVFRAQIFPTEEDLEEYKQLLTEGLVKPSRMEIFTINIDGTERKQITSNGSANFAPYFHPSGEKILFSSDLDNPREHNFEIYLIDLNGENLERVTFSDQFDGFPMFSYDGTKLVFCSNRNNGGTRSTNVFIADWVD